MSMAPESSASGKLRAAVSPLNNGVGARKGPVIGVKNGRVTLANLAMTSGPLTDVLQSLQKLIDAGGRHLVITANVDQILSLAEYPGLVTAYQAAAMRLIDGMPIIFLARALGAKSAHRHTGADLLPHCAAAAEERSWRIVITGGADEVGRRAVAALRKANPGTDIRHLPFPMIQSIGDPAAQTVVDDLHRVGPDLVFLCLGSPKQEEWFLQWRQHLPEAVYIGTGAAVDFAAGTKVRAPAWVQSIGFEWLWRLVQEPRRLAGRYLLRGPKFALLAGRSWRQSLRKDKQ